MGNNERVLRLSDLLSILLRKAIPILCITLVFTLLGFVYSYRNARSAEPAAPVDVTQEDLDRAQTRYDIAAHSYETASGEMDQFEENQLSSFWDQVSLINEKKAQLGEYLDTSPLMSLDPYDCAVSGVSLLVCDDAAAAGGENESASAAGARAASAVSSICTLDTAVLEKTRQILGVDDDLYYVRQLVCVYNDNGVVHIRVYSDDTEAAAKAVDFLCKTVTERLSSSGIGFSLEELCRYSGRIVDNELMDRQLSLSEEYTKEFKQLKRVEKIMSELNSNMDMVRSSASAVTGQYNSARQDLVNTQNAFNRTPDTGRSARPSVRTIVLSCIIGLFIGCFAAVCAELLNGRINSQSELLGRYSFPLLGLLPRDKKRLFDKTIRRLDGESSADFDTSARAAAQSLLSVSEDRSACFVSTLGSETAATLVPYLDGRIGVCGDILGDPEAVKALNKYDSIVLVEKRGRSVLSLIDNEVLRAKASNKEILGIVLI